MTLRVSAENINKRFVLYRESQAILPTLLGFLHRGNNVYLQALKDISFTVQDGESLGIIGRNGSGKSTLLKILGGIYVPDGGSVVTNGSTLYLSGFARGTQGMLTVRENIFFVGSLMGLRGTEMKKRFEQIVTFSGLEDFLDVKVFKLSSGMVARLNFSIAIFSLHHKNPEILLLDEVFAGGGDADFSIKSLTEMENLLDKGATMLLASHNFKLIAEYCKKTIWLEHGEIRAAGSTLDVIQQYADFMIRHNPSLKEKFGETLEELVAFTEDD